ncbi:hypothetical protein BAAM0483_01530 [Bifidobacterium animalis subsp. animalis MCC 0483]|uniref:Uncharacterized protein n=1 Tax=Bifidobacterium animalis subsp. animalis MCC 0483 TaxID=1365955 RepID=A0AB34TB19_9BIFI|nr:hypothetical protein BAAM0483_01530 [Bifidobacterium animalis subsp. animalis MCC 0483]KOA61204.1 hypothetical protein BAAM0499_06190 [Bifidobacterium animalis subsp. animalis MCC 0499]
MNAKDWIDAINGLIANIIAVAALVVAIRRKPRHKK